MAVDSVLCSVCGPIDGILQPFAAVSNLFFRRAKWTIFKQVAGRTD